MLSILFFYSSFMLGILQQTKEFSIIQFIKHARVRLNRSRFVIHDEVLNFHDWILCYREPLRDKIKLLELSMDLWNLNNMKVIVTFWTLNCADCVPVSCTISVLFTIEITNLKNLILAFSKKMIIPPLILVFDFIG